MSPERLHAIDFRRHLRRESTDAEIRIWWALRARSIGAKFRRQHSIGPFTVDFYCTRLRLAVEVDGAQHAEDSGLQRDSERDAQLAAMGIRVMRFTNAEALTETEGVVQVICDEVGRMSTARESL